MKHSSDSQLFVLISLKLWCIQRSVKQNVEAIGDKWFQQFSDNRLQNKELFDITNLKKNNPVCISEMDIQWSW